MQDSKQNKANDGDEMDIFETAKKGSGAYPVEAEKEQETKPAKPKKDKYAGLVKVELEKPLFDQTTGKKLSKPRIKWVPEKEIKEFKRHAELSLGYTVKIVNVKM